MPKTYFGSGTIVTPANCNSWQNPIFDGQDLDGHHSRLTDDALSNDPNQIKGRLAALLDEFKVTVRSGLYVKVAAGVFKTADQKIYNLEETILLCQANSHNYICIGRKGSIFTATFFPENTLLLAVVLTDAANIVDISDRRARFAEPLGVTSDAGSFGRGFATVQYVKQLFLILFYGDVPTFALEEQSISWDSGVVIFDGATHSIAPGSYSVSSDPTNWYYLYAEKIGINSASIAISSTPPSLATQQLWWKLYVTNGLLKKAFPVKPGFGV